MYDFAIGERWYSSSASKKAFWSPLKSDWWVCMPEPFSSGQRLRHEGGVDAVRERDLLHDEAVGHRVVGHRQRVGVAQVDLVLAGRDFVVAVLDADAHLLEREDRLAAQVAGDVERRQVEVAALVERRRALSDVLEVEELQLRADVEGEAEVGGALELALEDVARVALERRAVRVLDVAEHAGDAALARAPGQELRRSTGRAWRSCRDSSMRAKPSMRAAVEAHALLERLLQLLDGDREALEGAEDVGEPEPDELDVVVAARLQHVVFLVVEHLVLSRVNRPHCIGGVAARCAAAESSGAA